MKLVHMTKKVKRARRLKEQQPDFRNIKLTRTASMRMEAALEGQHRLQLAVAWTAQRPMVLLSLQVKTAPGNLWRELIDPMRSNVGRLVVDMGLYSEGTMAIRFAIGALTAIPKAATFLVEDEQRVTEFKPASGTKAIKQGEQWKESGKYNIGDQP